jgi:hypothetical protein
LKQKKPTAGRPQAFIINNFGYRANGTSYRLWSAALVAALDLGVVQTKAATNAALQRLGPGYTLPAVIG